MLISIFADNEEGNKGRLWKFLTRGIPARSLRPIPRKPRDGLGLGQGPDS